MISHEHPVLEFEPGKLSVIRSRILLGTALGMGVIAIAGSGVLMSQLRPLQQQVSKLDTAVQTYDLGSKEEISTLKKQVSTLDQTAQAQASKFAKTDALVSTLNSQVTELKKELATLKRVQTNQSVISIGSDQPQAVGSSFWVTDLKAKAMKSGVTLTGNMMNASSIRHTHVNFKITVLEFGLKG